MSIGDNNYDAETLATEYRTHLLSTLKIACINTRIEEIKDAICSAELIGTQEEVSISIGKFHLLKGKLDAFQEILDDHNQAQDALQEMAAARQ